MQELEYYTIGRKGSESGRKEGRKQEFPIESDRKNYYEQIQGKIELLSILWHLAEKYGIDKIKNYLMQYDEGW